MWCSPKERLLVTNKSPLSHRSLFFLIQLWVITNVYSGTALSRSVPARQRGWADGVGRADALAEGAVDLAEARPLTAFLLPAVQHQLVQRRRAVHWSRQPKAVLDGFDHLNTERWVGVKIISNRLMIFTNLDKMLKNLFFKDPHFLVILSTIFVLILCRLS